MRRPPFPLRARPQLDRSSRTPCVIATLAASRLLAGSAGRGAAVLLTWVALLLVIAPVVLLAARQERTVELAR